MATGVYGLIRIRPLSQVRDGVEHDEFLPATGKNTHLGFRSANFARLCAYRGVAQVVKWSDV
jgi:hypothetical protein